jgi:hypothetical protein
MGNTCASVHVHWRGPAEAAVKAVDRAYGKLGYRKVKRLPPEGGRRVFLRGGAGAGFLSIYDSANAKLDSGDLKDLAREVSRLLKTGVLATSVYDSDTYELVLFDRGRQVDLMLTEADTYEGPLKQLPARTRAARWSRVFRRPIAPEAMAKALTPGGVFAEFSLVEVGNLVGVPGGRVQTNYQDLIEDPEDGDLRRDFQRKPLAPAPAADDPVRLRNYFDRDNSRKLLVFPAAWPVPIGAEDILTWLMINEGGEVRGGRAVIEIEGPEGLEIRRGFMNGAKFHNGQIVGGYELPPETSKEAALAYLESKRFTPVPAGVAPSGAHVYEIAYPNLYVPAVKAGQATQYLVVLQFHAWATAAGDWTIRVTLHPGAEEASAPHRLPPIRITAAPPAWLPLVTGGRPDAPYDIADTPEEGIPDDVLDVMVQRMQDYSLRAAPPAEARAVLRERHAGMHAHQYKSWRYDAEHHIKTVTNARRLEQPAILANIAIVRHQAQASLDLCRAHLETWLDGVAGAGEVRVRAQRQMTEAFHVGKVKKTWPLAALRRDKAWAKFFDAEQRYQSVVLDLVPDGGAFPTAGLGVNLTLAHARGERGADDDFLLALSLRKMRGRDVAAVATGDTAHLFAWCVNHPEPLAWLGVAPDDMRARLDGLARAQPPLQAWHGAATWIPAFDLADGWESTVYESMSVLNTFRGVLLDYPFGLKQSLMTASWCANVLRMVAPSMWLGEELTRQLDPDALARAATVTPAAGHWRIEKRPDRTMADLERALLPLLPIEIPRLALAPPT